MTRFSKLLIASMLLSSAAIAQKSIKSAPKNWHLLDQKESGFYGISLDKAYTLLQSKKAKSKTVLVAVIDSGIDTLHEDLKDILWRNPGEVAGNGVDDDKNGYIDDIYGWNFIGGKDGRNVKENSLEVSRVYHGLKKKYEGRSEEDVPKGDMNEYIMWKKAEKKITGDAEAGIDPVILKRMALGMQKADSTIKTGMGKVSYTGNELDAYQTKNDAEKKAKTSLLGLMKDNGYAERTNTEFIDEMNQYIAGEEAKMKAKNDAPKDSRGEIVKDDETNVSDRDYGNRDVLASTPFHGTHCAGIIAASRKNNKGIDGVADNVRIMMLRAVPDGDEHDKDIANAIRYAVNNGAQIISMSFGKDFSPQKQWVDDAVKYAESKGVLLVHAAGNDNKDVDTEDNYPSAVSVDGKYRASNWITVGASGDPTNGGLTASFSNYGKKEVDLFAPGVQIYSTIPGKTTYGQASGTSMACPVVAGVAALILEYYPTLSAKQIKYVLEKSSVQPDIKVNKPGTDETVNLSDISRTGGIVNAFEAVKLAATLKGERKVTKEVLPKPKMIKTKKG